MERMKGKIAVMGFGNPCRSDDGIGIYVIDQLKKQCTPNDEVSFFDMGTGAFEVLFKLRGHSKIILVDAVVNTGEEIGTVYKVPASDLISAPQEDPMVFLHSLKWNQALSYAKKILQNDYPHDISVYLIAVADTRLEIQLSDEVKQAGDKVIEWVKNELIANGQVI